MSGITKKENKGDFEVLEKAAEQIKEQLKIEEKFPDLRDRLNLNSTNVTQQFYFEPYQSECGSMLEHKGFIPLPSSITEQFGKVACASFMGLIPEINRAWITVDNKLFLWDYLNPSDYLQYDGLSEVIVSVTLATPKPGIFTEIVKYVLVLATPVEIILLAITWHSSSREIRMQHTKYAIPSDEITMIKILSTQSGRIFMGGNDGNLYELIYENQHDSWSTYLGIGETYKCRKINHSSWNIVNIIPPLLKGIIGWEDTLSDMVVDDIRSLLYTITQKGNISIFYLGDSNDTNSLNSTQSRTITPLLQSYNLFSNLKTYFDNISHNLSVDSQYYDPVNQQITIIGFHVISQTESKSLNLLVVLSSGLRIYLSATDEMGFISSTVSQPPTVLRIQHVRGIPNINYSKPSAPTTGGSPGQGFSHLTTYNPNIKFRSSYYSHGVYLANYAFNQSLTSDPNPQDILLGLTEDLQDHDRNPTDINSLGAGTPTHFNTLKEAISLIPLSQYRQSRPGDDSFLGNNRIYDIQETCPQLYDTYLSRLRVLASISKTPSDLTINRNNLQNISPSMSSNTPPGFTHSLSYAGRDRFLGISSSDYPNICQLNEFANQHLPVPTLATQRQFLCLTLSGIHVFNKLRPIDYLLKVLTLKHISTDYLTELSIFKAYSPLQSGAMCVGLSCGLPMDVGSNSDGVETYQQKSSYITSSDTLKRRAITTLIQLGGLPSYRRGGYPTTSWAGPGSSIGAMDFVPSLSYQSFLLFASRLLRPIWYQSVITFLVNQPVAGSYIPKTVFSAQPKKQIKHLLTSAEIELYRIPLIRLLGILREYFSSSIRTIPSYQQNKQHDTGTDTGSGKSNVLISLLDKNKRIYENETVSLEVEGKKFEEYNYHLLYRLLSRTQQLLSLLEILQQIEVEYLKDANINIDWAKLDNITFYKLISTSKGHDLIRQIITDLLKQLSNHFNQSSRSNNSTKSNPLAPLNQPSIPSISFIEDTITYLTNNCYLWFAPGDRYLYEGNKLYHHSQSLIELSTSISGDQNSIPSSHENEIKKSLQLTCEFYLKSSKYWKSYSDVCQSTSTSSVATGSAPAGTSMVTTVEGNCTLWDICSKLVSLGGESVIPSVIDICLTASENFGTKHVFLNATSLASTGTPTRDNLLSTSSEQWEKDLYNNYEILTEDEKKTARISCYNTFLYFIKTIFHSTMKPIGTGYISIPLSSEESKSGREDGKYDSYLQKINSFSSGIKYALSLSDESEYHLHIYSYLYQLDKGILVTLESKHIENYLREYDNILLYNHYSYHGRHGHAAYLMDLLAHSEDEVDINQRIAYFTRAINSASQASLSPPPSLLATGLNSEVISHYSIEKLEDLKEKLQIAELQRTILVNLQQEYNDLTLHKTELITTPDAQRQYDHLAQTVRQLNTRLFSVSELFNEITEPYKLWEYSLIIIYLCKHDDTTLVGKLWKSIIYRIVPKNARNPETQEFLDDHRRKSQLLIDKRRQKTNILFEESQLWITEIEEKVYDLGSRFRSGSAVYGSGDQGVTTVGISGRNSFPLSVVIEELEEITSLALIDNPSLNRGWVYRCLLKTGVGHGELLEVYMEVYRKWNGKKANKLLQLLSSIASLSLDWIRLVTSHTSPNTVEGRELMLCARSGKYRNWMEKVLQQLSTLSGHVLTPSERKQLQEAQYDIKEAENKVISLLLI